MIVQMSHNFKGFTYTVYLDHIRKNLSFCSLREKVFHMYISCTISIHSSMLQIEYKVFTTGGLTTMFFLNGWNKDSHNISVTQVSPYI